MKNQQISNLQIWNPRQNYIMILASDWSLSDILLVLSLI